jgi:hypothetical protein
MPEVNQIRSDSSEISKSIDDPMRLAMCVAAGQFDDWAKRWLQSAFVSWLKLDGTVPLEQCLHIPKASKESKKMRLARRNVCLMEAAKEIDFCSRDSAWDGAVRLERELEVFVSRGAWTSWRRLASPPDGTSRLRTALFHFSHANYGEALSAKQIDRIVRHIFESRCL